jgi:hypothetical protein
MSGSSSSSPPRATEVSSSRRPQMAARDKNVGLRSRQIARLPERTSGRPHPCGAQKDGRLRVAESLAPPS